MNTINNAIGKVEYVVGTVLLISIIVLVFVSAFLRLVGLPLVWSVDLSQLMFVWISMIGADLALKKGSHMGVDLLVRQFPLTLQKILSLFTYIICIAFVVFMAYWGIRLCVMNYLRTYQTLNLSYSFATAAVPCLSITMTLTIAEQLISLLGNWNNTTIVQ